MDKKETVTYELCNVKGSCGHWLPDFWLGVDGYSCKEYDNGLRVASFGSLCPECYAERKRFNMILYSGKDVRKWIQGKSPYYCCPYCEAEIEVEWDGKSKNWNWKCDKCGCSEEGGTVTIVNPWKED